MIKKKKIILQKYEPVSVSPTTFINCSMDSPNVEQLRKKGLSLMKKIINKKKGKYIAHEFYTAIKKDQTVKNQELITIFPESTYNIIFFYEV